MGAANRSLMGAMAWATLAAPASQAQEASGIEGVWRNPRDTVHIELKPCGALVCGYVVWASDAARQKAQKGGGGDLVGQQLLRDFNWREGRTGRGKVYVPDLNTTFSGAAERVDERTIKARGCVIAGLICKSQIWTRIEPAGD